MTIDRTTPPGAELGQQPTTVAPSTRVTVAFPFSTIKIHEPDEKIRALAVIVADLADQLASIESTPAAQALRERARACANELAS